MHSNVQLIAEAAQLRSGKLIVRGERFSAPAAEADDLVALRFASRVPINRTPVPERAVDLTAEKNAPEPQVAEEVVAAESVQQHPVRDQTQKPQSRGSGGRGRYARRDMRAKG